MQKKPEHENIKKYGYMLNYSPSEDNWFASMETDKGSAWYKWLESKKVFDLIVSYHVPNDIILDAKEETELYLKDAGIIENDPHIKTFKNISVGDNFYMISDETHTPTIRLCKINRISQMNNDPLSIGYESTRFTVPLDKRGNNRDGIHFLSEKDCKEKLIEICISRIVKLSKAIGSAQQ
ncbi:MAG: hypothetical protein GY941_23530 [Planctomycetes bacterium]|nr:hypothetical protein [Planctomycetota bacterium]